MQTEPVSHHTPGTHFWRTVYNAFRLQSSCLPIPVQAQRLLWTSTHHPPQIWTVWHSGEDPLSWGLQFWNTFPSFLPPTLDKLPRPVFSRMLLTHQPRHGPGTPGPPQQELHYSTVHPTEIIWGICSMVVLKKRTNLQRYHLYSSHQVTTSVSSFMFRLRASYHILFPDELVESMGAQDTRCSALLPHVPPPPWLSWLRMTGLCRVL